MQVSKDAFDTIQSFIMVLTKTFKMWCINGELQWSDMDINENDNFWEKN